VWKKNWWSAERCAFFSQQMNYLLSSGIPLIFCVDLLMEQNLLPKSKGEPLKEALERGESLSRALQRVHAPALFQSLIRGSEEHGEYALGFRQCESFYSARVKWQRELWKMSAYPLMVALLVMVAFSFMAVYVIPQFFGLYRSMGVPLPWLTARLFSAYGSMGTILLLFLGVMVGLAALHFLMRKRTLEQRARWESFIYSFPFIQSYMRHRMTHYASMQCGALLAAGIPILSAVELTEKMAPWAVLSRSCKRIRERLMAGEPLGSAMETEGKKWFLPLFPKMVAISEQSGQLQETFARVAEGTEMLLKSKVERWIRALEPLFIFTVGIFVAITVVALFLPMLQLVKML